MTIMQHPTAVRQEPTPQSPLVAAVLAIAANRVGLGRDWDTVLAGFGPAMDSIAADLETADEYDAGMRDHEVRTTEAAEATARQLRTDAAHSAAFVASLIQAGAR